MYILLIILHIIVCLILISTILLQAGRGGGLTESFGGNDSMQSVLGTSAPNLIKKVTEISAVGFLITSLILGMIATRRGRSLFETIGIKSKTATQALDTTAVPVAKQVQEEAKSTAATE
jgi:preprotein translocase subunit SecG